MVLNYSIIFLIGSLEFFTIWCLYKAQIYKVYHLKGTKKNFMQLMVWINQIFWSFFRKRFRKTRNWMFQSNYKLQERKQLQNKSEEIFRIFLKISYHIHKLDCLVRAVAWNCTIGQMNVMNFHSYQTSKHCVHSIYCCGSFWNCISFHFKSCPRFISTHDFNAYQQHTVRIYIFLVNKKTN